MRHLTVSHLEIPGRKPMAEVGLVTMWQLRLCVSSQRAMSAVVCSGQEKDGQFWVICDLKSLRHTTFLP